MSLNYLLKIKGTVPCDWSNLFSGKQHHNTIQGSILQKLFPVNFFFFVLNNNKKLKMSGS